MSKKTKLIIQIILFVILLVALIYYFTGEKQKKDNQSAQTKPITLEEIFVFNPLRTDLTTAQVERYRQEFEAEKKIITQDQSGFNFDALNHIAMIKKIVGDYSGAEATWKYVGLARPQNSVSFFNLAQLYAQDLKDNQKAEENFLITLKNSAGETGNEQYYITIVDFYTYFYSEKKTEAEKILLEALTTEQYKDSQDILALLATYYQGGGQPVKAKEYWQKVLQLYPENSAAKKAIEKLQ